MTRKMQFEENFIVPRQRPNHAANHRKACLGITAHAELDRNLDTRFAMRSLTLLLVVCAAVGQFASAQPNDPPSLDSRRMACAADGQKLCAGVQPGGGRIVACLKDHKDSLSDQCKQAAGLAANPKITSAPGAASSRATPSPAVSAPSVSAPP